VFGRGVSALIPVGGRRAAILGDMARQTAGAGRLLGGNAAVVSLLLAALYRPVCTTGVVRDVDLALGSCRCSCGARRRGVSGFLGAVAADVAGVR
jgi:hypothetical protein